MKGLKKLALVSAIAAVSAGANAQLQPMTDSAMSSATGQAGLTIDVTVTMDIGEIAYKDGGFFTMEGMHFGGQGGTAFDNWRMVIDVAGDVASAAGTNPVTGEAVAANAAGTERLAYGTSALRDIYALAAIGSGTTDTAGWAGLAAGADHAKDYTDGSLVIHMAPTIPLNTGTLTVDGGGVARNSAAVLADFVDAADFNFSIAKMGLQSSDYTVGSSVTGTSYTAGGHGTTLVSGLNVNGYLGVIDISINNGGNGFTVPGTGGALTGAGYADSAISYNAYFNITNMDMNVDIMGVALTGMKINNTRGSLAGLDSSNSYGFAQAQGSLFAVKAFVAPTILGTADLVALGTGPAAVGGTGTWNDGIGFNMHFIGDMDLGDIRFGSATGTSMGQVYLTDINFDAKMVISAH